MYHLQSDPNAGSSLAKTYMSPQIYLEDTISEEEQEIKALWDNALNDIIAKNNLNAYNKFKTIIVQYPDSKYALKSLSMARKMCKREEVDTEVNLLSDLLNVVENIQLKTVIRHKLASELIRVENFKSATNILEQIIGNNEDNYYENAAMFDLFNYYHKIMDDSKNAEVFLEEMKLQYPDSRITLMAREDFGEDVSELRLSKAMNSEMIEEQVELPNKFKLVSAYPNPFNPSTTLEYALPTQSDVECTVFDLSGNIIKEFSFNQNVGVYNIIWDASNVSSGIYLIRFVAEASDGSELFVDYQKVTLLK